MLAKYLLYENALKIYILNISLLQDKYIFSIYIQAVYGSKTVRWTHFKSAVRLAGLRLLYGKVTSICLPK